MLKAAALAAFAVAAPAQAVIIGFEDVPTPGSYVDEASFASMGIVNDYQGFEWGYGITGGWANRTFVDSIAGWGASTVAVPGTVHVPAPAPTGVTGNVYAWSFYGVQSLWIDFKGEANVNAVDVAGLAGGSGWELNSDSLQLFGYDEVGNQLFASAIIPLTTTMQSINLGFTGISFFEMRSDRSVSWFSLDQLDVSPVPAPATPGLTALGLLGIATLRRRRKA
jgi:hypothetical protein